MAKAFLKLVMAVLVSPCFESAIPKFTCMAALLGLTSRTFLKLFTANALSSAFWLQAASNEKPFSQFGSIVIMSSKSTIASEYSCASTFSPMTKSQICLIWGFNLCAISRSAIASSLFSLLSLNRPLLTNASA